MNLRTAARSATAAALTLLLTAPVALAAPGSSAHGEDAPLNLPADTPASHASTVGPGGGSLVRTIVGLAVVLGVIYGLTWAMKQVKASREGSGAGHGLRPAATIPLGPNRSLHLIHAGRELVLVGVAEQGVTPIRTYTEDEARALGLIDAATPAAATPAPAPAAPVLPAAAGQPLGPPAIPSVLDRFKRITSR